MENREGRLRALLPFCVEANKRKTAGNRLYMRIKCVESAPCTAAERAGIMRADYSEGRETTYGRKREKAAV
jgi:hypothetical protein